MAILIIAKELTYEARLERQDESIPAPTLQILKAYKKALSGLSHAYCAGVFNITSPSQGSVLGGDSGNGKGKWNPYSKGQGRERGACECLGPAHGSVSDHVFFDHIPQQNQITQGVEPMIKTEIYFILLFYFILFYYLF